MYRYEHILTLWIIFDTRITRSILPSLDEARDTETGSLTIGDSNLIVGAWDVTVVFGGCRH